MPMSHCCFWAKLMANDYWETMELLLLLEHHTNAEVSTAVSTKSTLAPVSPHTCTVLRLRKCCRSADSRTTLREKRQELQQPFAAASRLQLHRAPDIRLAVAGEVVEEAVVAAAEDACLYGV